ncbi:acylphosphatase [Pontibacillus yanchengensis]|uniref:Acylphosphatase n=2 Tax=Pontibacillus yanchengensis TaxID=462910 RepID=A0ACC7VAX2_9BACI|nr:acylphosphatase [Pontibacillus yanchengensis]MYL32845.1 acylphosphatase [Pontibacillus yanchengensis]MYL51757.1 acylphosphatase [Pontibacillus yanchengensis]
MQHVHLLVKGRVQGVGFRFSAKQKAQEFNITGWVRNRNDGSVEIEAEGQDEDMKSFIESIKHGPSPYSKITDVDIDEASTFEGYKSFDIKS